MSEETTLVAREKRPVRVLLVDDQPAFRALARQILSRDASFSVVGEAPNAEAGMAQAEALRPDLVLMDVFMGGMNGLEATRLLLKKLPCAKVILVSAYDNLWDLAIETGATAFISKRSLSPETVRSCLDRAS